MVLFRTIFVSVLCDDVSVLFWVKNNLFGHRLYCNFVGVVDLVNVARSYNLFCLDHRNICRKTE